MLLHFRRLSLLSHISCLLQKVLVFTFRRFKQDRLKVNTQMQEEIQKNYSFIATFKFNRLRVTSLHLKSQIYKDTDLSHIAFKDIN